MLAIRIAEQMTGWKLEGSTCPETTELARRITRVNELVGKAKPGNELCSTQAIALIIEAWEREIRWEENEGLDWEETDG